MLFKLTQHSITPILQHCVFSLDHLGGLHQRPLRYGQADLLSGLFDSQLLIYFPL